MHTIWTLGRIIHGGTSVIYFLILSDVQPDFFNRLYHKYNVSIKINGLEGDIGISEGGISESGIFIRDKTAVQACHILSVKSVPGSSAENVP